jgi:hypothetical protein
MRLSALCHPQTLALSQLLDLKTHVFGLKKSIWRQFHFGKKVQLDLTIPLPIKLYQTLEILLMKKQGHRLLVCKACHLECRVAVARYPQERF